MIEQRASNDNYEDDDNDNDDDNPIKSRPWNKMHGSPNAPTAKTYFPSPE